MYCVHFCALFDPANWLELAAVPAKFGPGQGLGSATVADFAQLFAKSVHASSQADARLEIR